MISKSPFLAEHYRNYFRGGIADMSAWVVQCWNVLEDWLTNGIIGRFCKNMDLYWNEAQDGLKRRKSRALFSFDASQFVSRAFVYHDTNQTSHDRKIHDRWDGYSNSTANAKIEFVNYYLFIKDVILAVARTLYENLIQSFGYHECRTAKSSDIKLSTNVSFSQLGTSFAYGDFNGDGKKELALSAPYFHNSASPYFESGAVYILKENHDSGFVEDNYQYYLTVNVSASRFGYSLAVVDLNQDGIDDLAVSAPSHGGLDLEYTGRVYVYFGNNQTGLNHPPDLVIQPNIVQPYHLPGKIWPNQFMFFGELMQGEDIDRDGFKDLIIQSPRAASLPFRHQVSLLFYLIVRLE
jgi:hypothetical protein